MTMRKAGILIGLLLLTGCNEGLSDEQRNEAYGMATLALRESSQAMEMRYRIEELERRVQDLEDGWENAEIE